MIAGVLLLLAIGFAIERSFWLFGDRDHPDVVLLREEIARTQSAGEKPARLNLIAVNGGNWRALCLVGANENPREILRAFGRANRIRVPTLERMRAWLYVGGVPKDSLALIFVTNQSKVRTRRVPGPVANAERRKDCALRSDDGLVWR